MKKISQSQLNQSYTVEACLLKDTVTWLNKQRKHGIKLIRVVDKFAKGYSDLFIVARGKFIAAELKDDTGVASAHQKEFIADVQQAGAPAGVCRTIQDVKDLIEDALYCTCDKSLLDTLYTFSFCPQCGKERNKIVWIE